MNIKDFVVREITSVTVYNKNGKIVAHIGEPFENYTEVKKLWTPLFDKNHKRLT